MAVSCASATATSPYELPFPSLLRLPSPRIARSDIPLRPVSVSFSGIAYPAAALAYYSTSSSLHCKSGNYNVQITVGDEEPEDRVISRFRREVLKAGILQECRRRRFFENKQEKIKRKAREASRRNRKRRPQLRTPAQNKHKSPNEEKYDEEDDNWDLPDVDIPYC